MSISRQEWADWVRSPVTQAVTQALAKKTEESLQSLIKMSLENSTIEQCGMEFLCLRNYIAGIGEFLDQENLKDAVEVVDED